MCKSVGIIVNIEVDLTDKSKNRININLYDKDNIPLMDEIQMNDYNMNKINSDDSEWKDDDESCIKNLDSSDHKYFME